MESNISNALVLLTIGMITVFLILALVVISGNILIKIVNKYTPEPTKKFSRNYRSVTVTAPETLAAIATAVETVTAGHGKVESIQKVEN
ncbi:MAG TPA: oxaloacetate decarboxylase [Saprospirales bacterium]|jgi:oxaloacetate decarboxylase gamma subunit|nr:oxaloacetate decarboxylase [Saprospirales bacterium]